MVIASGALMASSMTAGAQLRKGQSAPNTAVGAISPQGVFHGQRPGGRFGAFLRSLNLTKDQRAQIKPIVKSAHEQAKAVREDKSIKRSEKIQKIKAIAVNALGQIRPILTAEQQAKLDAFIQRLQNGKASGGSGPGAGSSRPNGYRLRQGAGARPGKLNARPGAGTGSVAAPETDDLGLDL